MTPAMTPATTTKEAPGDPTGSPEDAGLDGPAPTKGERTRQRLLELAIERFGDRGYRGTSVSEIARAGGLTQAAAYAYFPGKEAMFEAAVDADAAAILRRAHEKVVGTDVHMLVPALLIALIGLLDEHPLARRVLAGQEQEELARLVNLPALQELSAWIADEVQAAQRDGRARLDIDATAFADGAETMLLGLLMAVAQVGGSYELRRQIGVVTVWDRVLRTTEPDGSAP
jgi:AcrR family transcriptional regulator